MNFPLNKEALLEKIIFLYEQSSTLVKGCEQDVLFNQEQIFLKKEAIKKGIGIKI